MAAENAKLIDFNGTAQEQLDISNIAETTAKTLAAEHNIVISLPDAIPTIVYEFLYRAAQYLDKNKDKDEDKIINIMNLIEMGVTYRESPEDGEKYGNFAPYVQAGTILKTIIKSDELTETEE